MYNTLKESAKKSGDFGPSLSGKDIRQARIRIDNQIIKELGETTFGSPQYKGIKAAEIDARNLINRLNEDLLRYPGQLEKLNKMNEFVGTATQRGIEVDLKNQDYHTKDNEREYISPSKPNEIQRSGTHYCWNLFPN